MKMSRFIDNVVANASDEEFLEFFADFHAQKLESMGARETEVSYPQGMIRRLFNIAGAGLPRAEAEHADRIKLAADEVSQVLNGARALQARFLIRCEPLPYISCSLL